MNFMNGLIGTLGLLGSFLISLWVSLRYVLLGTYRLDGSSSKNLFDVIRKEGKFGWVLNGDYAVVPRYPNIWETFVVVRGIPMFYSRHERLLTAGWKGKEEQTSITFPRFMKNKIEELLAEDPASKTIPVNLLTPHEPDRLGEVEVNPEEPNPPLDEKTYLDIEEDVRHVLSGKLRKTSAILYGEPGNGKSRFVKYLASKYSLPINVVQLGADWSNHDIMLMFASIPRRCIVLLEDFDNHFHGREPAIKNDAVKFTFDSVINSLDGVHNDYRQVVFIMTANDITKVDDSLKDRPSRFKFVREFGPPSEDTRRRILGDEKLVRLSKNLSLDKVFLAASRPQTLLVSNEQLQLNIPI